MGLLDFLFKKRPSSTSNRVNPTPHNVVPFYAANVRTGSMTWKMSNGKIPNSYSAWNDRSLQNILHTISYETISVRAVDISKSIIPDDYECYRDDDVALVDDDGFALATIGSRQLTYAGYKKGDYVECAVVHINYYGEDIVQLHLLMTQFAIDHEDEIREMVRMSRIFGSQMPFGTEYIEINVDYDKWPIAHHDGNRLHSFSMRELPVPKGSKAKPHIMISLDGVDGIEISARSTRYKYLAERIGESPIACASIRYESIREGDEYYYKVVIAYLPKSED